MSKILILKNDRVGDLFHSLRGIYSIIESNQRNGHCNIEIILSNFSKEMSFLFKTKNIKISFLNYNLSIFNKFYLLKKIFQNNYDKIYILSPKNFYFYFPLITKSKIYAITVKDFKRERPNNFLKKKLYKYYINDRTNKKLGDSISNLIERLCNEYSLKISPLPNNINNKISNPLKQNFNLLKKNNFIHVHYKNSLFTKNGWSLESFVDLLNKILKTKIYDGISSNVHPKILLSSDIGNNDYNNYFLKKFSYINFDNEETKFLNSNIIYLHNIKINDLFEIISHAHHVISPHGTMTVMASYLNRKVVDIYDVTISKNSFREFKPHNKNYNFLILKNSSYKIKNKIINFL